MTTSSKLITAASHRVLCFACGIWLLLFADAAQSSAATLNVTFNSAASVGATASSYTATGKTVGFTLNYAPVVGTNLTVIQNTGLSFISGQFSNLAQGQSVALTFGGITYSFVANYFGGSGNDLVLVWARNRLMAWGYNYYGQLGNGSSQNASSAPIAVISDGVLAGKTITSVSAGSGHTVVLCSDGTVATWGSNNVGQLGNNDPTHNSSVPVAIITTGVLAGKTIIAVSAGAGHNLALCSDGTVAAWGWNSDGQLGNNGSVTMSAVPVAVNATGVLAGKTVIAVSAGEDHSLALCSDGTVAAWGWNAAGQLGNNSSSTSRVPVAVTTTGLLAGKTVIAISAGNGHSLALCSDGTLAGWGSNDYGQLGNNSTGIFNGVPVAVTQSGVLSGKTVTAIAAGGYHSLALSSDGTVTAWGYNYLGPLGNNSTTNSSVPVAVISTGILAGKTVNAITGMNAFSLALCSDGTVSAWGANGYGALGNNATTDSSVPVAVTTAPLAAGERFVAIPSGMYANHSLALVAMPTPPPTATTLAASEITATGATLNGTVNANGTSTTVTFNYGTSTGYGSSIAASPSSATGNSDTGVTANLSGLTPGTTYHFRVTGTGASTTNGNDLTFTTLSNNANLANLVPSVGTLSPAFDSATTSYTMNVPHTVASMTLTATVAHASATVRINSVDAVSGSPSDPISLAVGSNVLPIAVTAQDGTVKNYSVTLTRLPQPVVSFASSTSAGSESAGTINLTVSLNTPAPATISVPFTISGTATSGSDYTITSSPLTFTTGQTSQTIAVAITDDVIFEPDETVVVTLGTPSGAGSTLGTPSAHTLTIVENDSMPVVRFTGTEGSDTVPENAGSISVAVGLSNPSASAVSVPVVIHSLYHSTRFTVSPMMVTFAPGQTSALVTVTITNDSIYNEDVGRTLGLSLGTPTGAVRTTQDAPGDRSSRWVYITDDEFGIGFTTGDATIGEGGRSAWLQVQLAGAPAVLPGAITVPLTVTGTATAGSDFIVSPSTITFPPGGSGSVMVKVSAVDDAVPEFDETVILTLGTPVGTTAGKLIAGQTVRKVFIQANDGKVPPASEWVQRNPLPTGAALQSVVSNGSLLVAVGAGGFIMTSPDGEEWTQRRSMDRTMGDPSAGFTNVLWTGSQFVAVGRDVDGGYSTALVMTSPDGLTWTRRSVPGNDWINSAAWNGVQFVAVGYLDDWPPTDTQITLTSSDGITWTRHTISTALSHVIAHGGKFAAINATGAVVTSTDGITWTPLSLPSNIGALDLISTGGQMAVLVYGQELLTSTDLVNWEDHAAPDGISRVRRVLGQWVGLGDGVVWTSSDLASWTQTYQEDPGSTAMLNDAVTFAGSAVIVASAGRVMTAPDAQSWSRVNRNVANGGLWDVIWANGQFVAVGEGGSIVTSPDGVEWTPRFSGTTNYLRAVVWTGARLVAFGEDGRTLTSSNGVTWTQRPAPIGWPPAAQWEHAIFSGSQIIATNHTGIYTSTDGVTWTLRKTANAYTVVASPARVLAPTASGLLASTDGGITWAMVPVVSGVNPAELDLQVWTGQEFLGLWYDGANQRLFSSSDGVSWTMKSVLPDLANALAWTGSQLLLFSGGGSYEAGLYTSADGVSWVERVIGSVWPLRAAVSNGTVTVAVGDYGTIMTSGVSASTANVHFAYSTAAAQETAGSIVVPVELSQPVGSTVTVPFTLSGTVTSADYGVSASPLTFTAGQRVKNITVTLKDDALVDPNETLIITLGRPAGGTNQLGNPTSFTLTITDGDALPVINEQPLSQLVAGGDSVEFSADATGPGALAYQWQKNGANIAGATTATYSIAAAALTHAGRYAVKVTNSSGSVTSDIAELGVVDSGIKTTQVPEGGTAVLTASAAGNGLTYQWFAGASSLGGDALTLGVTTRQLTLKQLDLGSAGVYTCRVTGPGGQMVGGYTNLVVLVAPEVEAPDFGTRMVSSLINVPVVASNYPARFVITGLPAGVTYSATTGVISGRPTAAGTSTIKITAYNAAGASTQVSSTLMVVGLPDGTAGSFTGNVARDEVLNQGLGGRFDFTTSGTGTLSGSVQLGGSTYRFAGALDTEPGVLPTAAITIARSGLTPVVFSLEIDPANSSVSGNLSVGASPAVAVTGWRNVWNATSSKADAIKGLYNFVLAIPSGELGNTAIPQGHGFGSFTISVSGPLTVSGKVADGTAFTASTFAGPNGEIVVFKPLYANKGSVLGQLTVTADAPSAFVNNSLAGIVSWSRVAQTSASARTYKAGFEPVELDAQGGKYMAPASGRNFLDKLDAPDNARLTFTGGGLDLAALFPDVTFRLGNTNAVIMPTAGGTANQARATFVPVPATGSFSGKFTLMDPDPLNAAKTVSRVVTYQGLVLRHATGERTGHGYFLLPQLAQPTASPPTTATTSPILSGDVSFFAP